MTQSTYLAKDSPERWIFNVELDNYFQDKDIVFDLTCPIVTGDGKNDWTGMRIEAYQDNHVNLYLKQHDIKQLAWCDKFGWYKEEYREIVLGSNASGEFLEWMAYNTVYGPIH